MTETSSTAAARFCSDCGARLNPNARFCHACGSSVTGGGPRASESSGSPKMVRWALPAVVVLLVVVISLVQSWGRDPATATSDTPLGATQAPDISSMTPEERADRLFNRVMRLSSEGKADSAAFFGPMALGAIEQLQPLDAHRRYDMGVVSLVMGDAATAKAQSDSILKARPTHLLGLSLAARVAESRGDTAAAGAFRRRLLAAEASELASGLGEYTDHGGDIRIAIEAAKKL